MCSPADVLMEIAGLHTQGADHDEVDRRACRDRMLAASIHDIRQQFNLRELGRELKEVW